MPPKLPPVPGSVTTHSWKDEWFTIVLSLPILLAFCGRWGAGVATMGFAALAQAPGWYVGCVVTALCASFGTRYLFGSLGLKGPKPRS